MIDIGLFIIVFSFVFSAAWLVERKEWCAVITWISLFLAITLIIVGVDKEVTESNYKNFRDKVYPDYSKDRDYQKWLVDNPKR